MPAGRACMSVSGIRRRGPGARKPSLRLVRSGAGSCPLRAEVDYQLCGGERPCCGVEGGDVEFGGSLHSAGSCDTSVSQLSGLSPTLLPAEGENGNNRACGEVATRPSQASARGLSPPDPLLGPCRQLPREERGTGAGGGAEPQEPLPGPTPSPSTDMLGT